MPSSASLLRHTFQHEKLGGITGWLRGDAVVQFRGLPFASIPDRFRQSLLRRDLPQQIFDATNPGPVCPTPPQEFLPFWQGPLPEGYPILQTPRVDEFECLNLSLSIPKNALYGSQETRKIPVLVFIHGGAFVGGNHAIQVSGREVFDAYDLVRYSIDINKPIITVAINYRVGPLGFLASRELADFNRANGEAVGNYGLHDQERALEWLSTFIDGFGGDPNQITIQGTSAGAASCHYQSAFPRRQFSRVILASGVMSSLGPLPLDQHGKDFDRVVTALSRDRPLGSSALAIVQACTARELTHAVPFDFLHPLIDGEYILGPNLQAAHRGEEPVPIMLGAAAYEDDLAQFLLLDFNLSSTPTDRDILARIQHRFASSGIIRTPLGVEGFPINQPTILKAYGVQDTAATPSKNLAGWAKLVAHCMFNIPAVHSAIETARQGKAEQVWLYHYDVPNLYPGCHVPAHAHHGVNDLVLFNVAPDQVGYEDREGWEAAVRQTQTAWISFIYGESPWEPLRRDSSVRFPQSAGPVFVFRGEGKGQQCGSLRDAVGELTAEQWAIVLKTFYDIP